MKKFLSKYGVVILCLLCMAAMFYFMDQRDAAPLLAATVVDETQDNTMPSQLWVTDSKHGTCSSASPETFSIAVAEPIWPLGINPTVTEGRYDAMLLFYQISSVTDNWIIETDYFYVDTDGDNKRDSFQCTATGADSGSPWHLLMMDWRGQP